MAKKKAATTAPEPMDPTAQETRTPVEAEVGGMTNTPRVAYAIKQLVKEVEELFPETPVEYSNVNGRNTALDVTFDLTAMDTAERDDLISLLLLIESDIRVDAVIDGGGDKDGLVLVSMRPNPLTQDSRDPFGLADALDVLDGAEENA